MPTTPQIIRTPKAYYVTRRIEGNSDWPFAFWRELFQNSVDAGARRIDITIDDADGKGSFGREAAVDRVVRVTFADDGKGMDGDTLRNVFFQPGETTKRRGDGNVGGFGTARLMLCFSQVRYGIRTQDWVVEGDGSEYTCMTLPEAMDAKRAEIAAAEAAGDARRAEQLRADLAALEADGDRRKGCRFEIDVDPGEVEHAWRRVDRRRLTDKLDEYLSLSQMPCKVFVNGEEIGVRASRGPANRRLVATAEGGASVAFGTIHTSQGERARHKGRIIVRSGGAAMFTEDTSSSHQVIVELDPRISRDILTENRDGLKQHYRSALAGFVEELVVDSRSALAEKDRRRHIEIRGGRGKMRVSAPAAPVSFAAEGAIREAADGAGPLDRVPGAKADEAAAALPKARYTTPEEYEVHGFGGVPKVVMDGFLRAVADGEETFLARLAEGAEAARFAEAARAEGEAALATLDPELAGRMAATLLARMAEAGVRPEDAEDNRYADMHDVHIQVDDIGDAEKLKNALRRHHPNYWRRKGQHLEGRGMQAHMLLAAWTVSVEHAVKALLAHDPAIAEGGLDFATGWYFGRSEAQYTSRGWSDVRTGAQHQERDGTHLFLLNPVFDNGAAAYDLTKERRERRFAEDGSEEPMGLQDLENAAIHEACHVMTARHDEEFANLQTSVAAMFDRAGARAAMREAVDAVRAAYGRGRSRIQAMDAQETAAVLEAEEEKPTKAPKARKREPRPAERLLAHAAPLAAMAAGTVAAPENADFPADALKGAFAGAVTQLGDGVAEVDCDRLQSLEAGIATAARNGWEAPIDLGAVIPPEGDLVTGAAADVPALDGFGDDLAALASEAPIGLGQADAVAGASSRADGNADVPDLSAFDGIGESLAALAAEPPLPAAEPAMGPGAEAVPSPAAPEPDLVDLDGFGDDLAALAGAAPSTPEANAPASDGDGWEAPIDIDADFPPVVEDPSLAAVRDLIGEDFDMDAFEPEAARAPAMR